MFASFTNHPIDKATRTLLSSYEQHKAEMQFGLQGERIAAMAEFKINWPAGVRICWAVGAAEQHVHSQNSDVPARECAVVLRGFCGGVLHASPDEDIMRGAEEILLAVKPDAS